MHVCALLLGCARLQALRSDLGVCVCVCVGEYTQVWVYVSMYIYIPTHIYTCLYFLSTSVLPNRNM